MSDKNIAYITSRFPTLTETFILREIEEVRRKGIKIDIYSLKTVNHQTIINNGLEKYVGSTNYTAYFFSSETIKSFIFFLKHKPGTVSKIIFEIVKTHISNPVYLLKALFSISKALTVAHDLRKKNIQKIHAHWATIPTTVAWAVSKLNNCEYTFTAHAWDIFKVDSMLGEKIQDSKAVVTCTKYNKGYLLDKYPNVNPDKIQAIYHGLDLERFYKGKRTENSTFTILSIGRLVKKKGFHILLKACTKLIERGIQFRCNIIYVDGNFGKEIFQLHKDLNLGEYVHFVPEMPQEKVIDYYYKSDCFVLSSVISNSGDRDGIPNVILEAFATGLPVISTDISGIPEVVINNKTGLLVKADNENELAAAIEKLHLDNKLRTKLGNSGMALVQEQFRISTNVDRLLSSIL